MSRPVLAGGFAMASVAIVPVAGMAAPDPPDGSNASKDSASTGQNTLRPVTAQGAGPLWDAHDDEPRYEVVRGAA